MEDAGLRVFLGIVFTVLFIICIVCGGFWGFLFPGIFLLFLIFACVAGEDI